jgi:hypothetical protein
MEHTDGHEGHDKGLELHGDYHCCLFLIELALKILKTHGLIRGFWPTFDIL